MCMHCLGMALCLPHECGGGLSQVDWRPALGGLACSDVDGVVPGEVLGLEVEGDADGHQERGVGGVHRHGDEAPGQRGLRDGVYGRPSALVPAQQAQPHQGTRALLWVQRSTDKTVQAQGSLGVVMAFQACAVWDMNSLICKQLLHMRCQRCTFWSCSHAGVICSGGIAAQTSPALMDSWRPSSRQNAGARLWGSSGSLFWFSSSWSLACSSFSTSSKVQRLLPRRLRQVCTAATRLFQGRCLRPLRSACDGWRLV